MENNTQKQVTKATRFTSATFKQALQHGLEQKFGKADTNLTETESQSVLFFLATDLIDATTTIDCMIDMLKEEFVLVDNIRYCVNDVKDYVELRDETKTGIEIRMFVSYDGIKPSVRDNPIVLINHVTF